jgi:dihydroorotase-like cyclic amidohydrolase
MLRDLASSKPNPTNHQPSQAAQYVMSPPIRSAAHREALKQVGGS